MTDSNTNAEDLHATIYKSLISATPAQSLHQFWEDKGLLGAIDSSTFDSIPIIGIIHKAIRTSLSIQQYAFIKKYARFLAGINTISASEREEFLNRACSDEAYRRQLAESLVIMLDRFEDGQKADYLADIFIALVQGDIDEDTYGKFADAILRTYIGDLNSLFRYFERGSETRPQWSRLYASSLAAPVTNIGNKIIIGPGFLWASDDGIALSKLILGSLFQERTAEAEFNIKTFEDGDIAL